MGQSWRPARNSFFLSADCADFFGGGAAVPWPTACRGHFVPHAKARGLFSHAKARGREEEYFFIRRLRRLPQIFFGGGGGLSCRCAAIQAAERKARKFCGPRLAVGILCLTRRREGAKARRREGAKMNTFSSANSVAARHAVLLRMPCCYANLSRYGVVARRVVAIRTRLLSSCCHCRSCH